MEAIDKCVVVYFIDGEDGHKFLDCDEFRVSESGALIIMAAGDYKHAFADGTWRAVRVEEK